MGVHPSPSPDDLAAEAAIAFRIEHWGADGVRSLTGREAPPALPLTVHARSWDPGIAPLPREGAGSLLESVGFGVLDTFLTKERLPRVFSRS